MSTPFLVPLINQPQQFTTVLNGVRYTLRVYWNDSAQCWLMDISDSSNNPILQSIPIVTGVNLLSQYAYLGIGGRLIAQTTNDPTAVPTFANLGTTGNLYYLFP